MKKFLYILPMMAFVFFAMTTGVFAAPVDDFVITVKTDNIGDSTDTQFTIPTVGGGYNYSVDCDNDGVDEVTGQTGSYTCDYGAGNTGTYTIRIKHNDLINHTGFPRIYFNNSGDKDKILSVNQWGTTHWTSMYSAFRGCSNLNSATAIDNGGGVVPAWATDSPDLSSVANMGNMFLSASAFNQDISSWDTSSITNMKRMFYYTSAFNQNIGNWNTSQVTDMNGMFHFASAFNQDIGNWNTEKVEYMYQMFSGATSFNQDIGNWNTEKVVSMYQMFEGVTLSTVNYDALLNGWNAQTLKNGVNFNGGNSKYCAVTAHDNMTSATGHNWTITDGGAQSDCQAPILSEQTLIGSTFDTTPNYTFNTDEEGIITYGGSCSSVTTNAIAGDNIITLNELSPGTYNNCTIIVTDAVGNISNTLTILEFTIDTTAPTLTQKTPVPTPTDDTTPSYTFNTDEAGIKKIKLCKEFIRKGEKLSVDW